MPNKTTTAKKKRTLIPRHVLGSLHSARKASKLDGFSPGLDVEDLPPEHVERVLAIVRRYLDAWCTPRIEHAIRWATHGEEPTK